MKKSFIILLALLNYGIALYAQSHTEEELYQMSDLFANDEELFVEDTTSGIYHMPRRILSSSSPFSHTNILHITPDSANGKNALIIVNSSVYESIKTQVVQYAYDIHYAHHIGVEVEVCTNGNYASVKNLILTYATNLVGVIFIGDIDVAYYEVENDFNQYGYKSWPCDLFYMDLDGQWSDSDNNGIYDNHCGNVEPEIFVGRISAYNIGNLISEVDGLKQFFIKDHQFWIGNLPFSRQALAYNNRDWNSIPYFYTAIEHIFGATNIDVCNCPYCTFFSKADYVNKNTSGIYGFIQLSAHSTPAYHIFNCSATESLYSNNIYNLQNAALGYNLFCCSACNWKSGGFNGYLGGAYLFNSPTCLFVVGSTKTGSLLYFNNFYGFLGSGNCVGMAMKNWWLLSCGSSHRNIDIFWHYGLSILGDPMITFNWGVNCPDTIILDSYDDTNLSNLQIYRAASYIQVEDNYHIPYGKEVILDAPSVRLSPSFVCPLGASLKIINNGCSN